MATRRRPKKKSSNSGIWIGSAISAAVFIIVIGSILFSKSREGLDRATSASSDANMVVQKLEEGLPELTKLNLTGQDTTDIFEEVQKVQNVLTAGGFEKEKREASAQVVVALLQAVEKPLGKNSLDVKIPPKRFDSPQVKKDLAALNKAVKMHIDMAIEDADFDRGREAAFAQVLFGEKIFKSNTRLKTRQSGLAVMRSGLTNISRVERAAYDDGAIDQDKLAANNTEIMKWNNAIKVVEDGWNAKLKTIETVNAKKGLPNIQDLIKIANEDQDPTFRIFAARRLGYALFERGDPSNQKAMKSALDKLSKSSDKAVATAAKEGRSIKDAGEYHELRK